MKTQDEITLLSDQELDAVVGGFWLPPGAPKPSAPTHDGPRPQHGGLADLRAEMNALSSAFMDGLAHMFHF